MSNTTSLEKRVLPVSVTVTLKLGSNGQVALDSEAIPVSFPSLGVRDHVVHKQHHKITVVYPEETKDGYHGSGGVNLYEGELALFFSGADVILLESHDREIVRRYEKTSEVSRLEEGRPVKDIIYRIEP